MANYPYAVQVSSYRGWSRENVWARLDAAKREAKKLSRGEYSRTRVMNVSTGQVYGEYKKGKSVVSRSKNPSAKSSTKKVVKVTVDQLKKIYNAGAAGVSMTLAAMSPGSYLPKRLK